MAYEITTIGALGYEVSSPKGGFHPLEMVAWGLGVTGQEKGLSYGVGIGAAIGLALGFVLFRKR